MLNGNQKAYRKLVEEYYDILFAYGQKFTFDHELVKDIIQELFITVWERRTNLSEEVNIRAYLLSSFRRALFRKLRPSIKVVDISDYNVNPRCFDIRVNAEEHLLAKEKSAKLAREMADVVNALPMRQKEVVYLKYFMGLSRDEIAETIQIAPQTVSNILQNALKNMRFKYFSQYKVS